MESKPVSEKKQPQKPLPLRYIVIAIVIFVLCFNLYLLIAN